MIMLNIMKLSAYTFYFAHFYYVACKNISNLEAGLKAYLLYISIICCAKTKCNTPLARRPIGAGKHGTYICL